MEFDFKKPLIILAICIGLTAYVRRHYSWLDVLAYTKNNPSPTYSPMVDYYVGTAYFMKSDYAGAVKAYDQLLADYATGYYGPRAFLRLGSAYEEMNNFQGAREAYEKYFELFPEGKDKNLVQSKYDMIKFKGLP